MHCQLHFIPAIQDLQTLPSMWPSQKGCSSFWGDDLTTEYIYFISHLVALALHPLVTQVVSRKTPAKRSGKTQLEHRQYHLWINSQASEETTWWYEAFLQDSDLLPTTESFPWQRNIWKDHGAQ